MEGFSICIQYILSMLSVCIWAVSLFLTVALNRIKKMLLKDQFTEITLDDPQTSLFLIKAIFYQ